MLRAVPLASLPSELRGANLEGSGPHLAILQSHLIGELAEEGLILPLNSRVSPTEQDRLLPTAVGGAQAPNKDGETILYGLPITFDTLALYYNKANFDEPDEPPADTEAMLRIAQGLTEPPIWGLAYTLSFDKTVGYLYAFGGRIFDDEGNLVLGSEGRAGAENWLHWLVELRQDNQLLAATDSIAVDQALMAQEAIMTIDWAHAFLSYHDLWESNLGVAVLPRLSAENRSPKPYVQSDVITLNARIVHDAEQRAAIAFMRYLLTREAQRELLRAGKQPTLLDLNLSGDDPDLAAARAFRAQAQQGQPIPNSRMANQVVKDVLEMMQRSVLRGLATPEEAVTRADTMLRERLDAAQGP
ncbi:MAG: extracellular solute-binding protein [Chloroflexales bacterium]|nr:extracellular solute-binding protein [Chloroflexales bacterium]